MAEFKREQETKAYRIYVTETLRLLTENTAKFAGGAMIKEKYYDIINQKPKNVDKMTGDQIVADIVKRAGLELA